MIENLEWILKFANLFFSIIAGGIAISLFRYRKKQDMKPWFLLIIVLVLFAVQEILGMLRALQIYETPHLTHLNPTIMLALLIWALILQIKK